MKIYIAGKITGLPRAAIALKFETVAAALTAEGHDVFIPTVLPAYESVPHEDYMHICYAMIDICDAIFLLDDWQKSKGARMECQYAADWRKQIIYQNEATHETDFPIVRK